MKLLLPLLLLPLFAASQTIPDKINKKVGKQVLAYVESNTIKANAGDTAAIGALIKFYDSDKLWGFKGQPYNFLQDYKLYNYWVAQGLKRRMGSCATIIGLCYLKSPVNHDSTKYYFQMAADWGDIQGMIRLAGEYDYRDVNAMYWYRQAAAKGNAEAAKEVADILTGLDHCYDKAYAFYKNGNMDEAQRLWEIDYKVNKRADAAFNVGVIYQKKGKTIYWAHAPDWYGKACDLGDVQGCMMAAKLNDDFGDRGSAMEYWAKADALGNKDAAGFITKTNNDIAAEQASSQAYWSAHNKKINDAVNNGTYKNPNAVNGTVKSPAINYYAQPQKTAAENDASMYEKMHKEQAERERYYKEKWGN